MQGRYGRHQWKTVGFNPCFTLFCFVLLCFAGWRDLKEVALATLHAIGNEAKAVQ